MKVAIISTNYPSASRPHRGIFVYRFVQELCRNNLDVTVIAPEAIHHLFKDRENADYGIELAKVYRPPYLSFSNKISYRGLSAVRWGMKSMALSVKLCAFRYGIKADFVYGHFFSSGLATLGLANRLNVSAVLTIGESRIGDAATYTSLEFVIRQMNRFKGIVAVSKEIQNVLMEKYNIPKNRIRRIPNAPDSRIFFPYDRNAMRLKYGLPLDRFIVIYVGHFNEWKGAHRLIKALNQTANVYGIFLGFGEQLAINDKILLAKAVPNYQVPEYLSAANLFVLPTRNEGSCNAISEALACGLPVISSDVPAIREQLDESVSILIDPQNERSIASAIQRLSNDAQLYEKMSESALDRAQRYTLQHRTKQMICYFNEILAC